MKYRKKPVEVEAMQFTEETKDRCFNQVQGNRAADYEGDTPIMRVQTVHGDYATVRPGDWIVKDPGRPYYYPVAPDVFEENFEPVE